MPGSRYLAFSSSATNLVPGDTNLVPISRMVRACLGMQPDGNPAPVRPTISTYREDGTGQFSGLVRADVWA